MALDFPSPATVGQVYLNWQWDGAHWVGTSPSTGWVDAPNDGVLYGRKSVGWSSVDAQLAARDTNTGRNYVHNPRFEVQQRGAGPWTTGGYNFDRWTLSITADTVSIAVSTLNDGARTQIGDESAKQALQNTFTGTASGTNYIQQFIEGVRRLGNKTVTVSFWAIAATAGQKISLTLFQSMGTGGSPSGGTLTHGPVITLTTTWARYSFSVTLPSMAAQVLGTNGNDSTILRIYYSAGASNASEYANSNNLGAQSGVVALWGVQLEAGSAMTPLTTREYADELRLCQRFYQLWNPPPVRGSAAGGGSNVARMGMALPVIMRANPALTLISPLPVYNGSQTSTITAIATNFSTMAVLEFDGTIAGTWSATSGSILPGLVYQNAGGALSLSADL